MKMRVSVQGMIDHHSFDHLSNRQGLALTPAAVCWDEPVETEIGIVGALLFGEEECEPFLVGEG
jgi:hypothetical protein